MLTNYSEKDPVTQQIEAMDGTSEAAKNIDAIAAKLETTGTARQMTALMRNEACPYDTIETLQLLKAGFFHQSGRFARAASDTSDENDSTGLGREILLLKAHHSIRAGMVCDRAASTRGRVKMTEDERQSLMDMTNRLEGRLIAAASHTRPDTLPTYEDFHHIETAVNDLLEPANIELIDVTF